MKEITFFDIVMSEINGAIDNGGVVLSYSKMVDVKKACLAIDDLRINCSSTDISQIVVDADCDKSDLVIKLYTDSVEINSKDIYFANVILSADYFTMSTNEDGDLVIGIGFENIWEQ